MAIPNNHIKIKLECRPCYVEGRKAMFHMWSSGHNGVAVRGVLGIVEFEDGKVAQVHPERIRFADGGEFHETGFVPPEVLDGVCDEQYLPPEFKDSMLDKFNARR